MANNVNYTGVKLNSESISLLKQKFEHEIPEGWEWIAHHMTMTIGQLPELEREKWIGKEVTLSVTALGKSDKAIAVAVGGVPSKNAKPHVTLAVNRVGGGKPVDSNLIPDENWVPINDIIILKGIVTEFEFPKETLNESTEIKDLPFYGDIIRAGGEIYAVGGAVRDKYLGKTSKDLDVVVRNLTADRIINIVKRHGSVKAEQSGDFPVILFTPRGGGETIDIAIPRTEKKKEGGDGYKDFIITADPKLPIEKDLWRRDFTINSMARDSEGNLIDPYGGLKDIESKLIRLTNPSAFAEDPLRMLRAVQFASRFEGFVIDPETYENIKENAYRIKSITKERIQIEFEKIISKGNPEVGAKLLVDSGLYEHIFGTEFVGDFEPFANVTRESEFYYWLISPFTDSPAQYYKKIFKGNNEVAAEIDALTYLYANNNPGNSLPKKRMIYSKLYSISPAILQSSFVKSLLGDVEQGFATGEYPINVNKLALRGNDFLRLGFKNKQVGEAQRLVLNAIYTDKIKNDRDQITNFIQNNRQLINEAIQPIEKTIAFYDFDGTLMDSPLPTDENKMIYQDKTGQPWPYKGWWGRPESLDLDIFDIQPNPDVERQYRMDVADPNTEVVLLTNRISSLSDPIKKILQKHNMKFKVYSFKHNGDNKGERMLNIMDSLFPDATTIRFYDDDVRHFDDVRNSLIDSDYDFKLYAIVDGKIQK